MNRSVIVAGLAAAILLATADSASAQLFRRRHSAPIEYLYYPAPTDGGAPSSSGAASEELIKQLAAKLPKEEQEQFHEIAKWNDGGWFGQIAADAGKLPEKPTQEEGQAIVTAEVVKYLSGTSDDRKKVYDYFKKETAPMTAADSDHFLEMVKGNVVKTTDFLGYAQARVSERAKVYKVFLEKGGAAPEVTPEELAQFLDTVKANKEAKKPAFNDEKYYFQVWQAMSPAQRKAIYEARGK